MKEQILNQNWYFHLEDEKYRKSQNPVDKDELTSFGFNKTGEAIGFAARRYENLTWRTVDLPHDYVVELDFDSKTQPSNGLKPVNDVFAEDPVGPGRTDHPTFPIAWYRKHFYLTEEGAYCDEAREEYGETNLPAPEGKRYFLRFEGVYRDFILWVNGVYIDRVMCGYLGVTFDITDQLLFGQTNSIAVRVDCSQYDGWWYDGGGIYRDVKLLTTQDFYCHGEDLYVHTTPEGQICVTAALTNKGCSTDATMTLCVSKNGKEICRTARTLSLARGQNSVTEQLSVKNPCLWDVDDPQLYTLQLFLNGELEQSLSIGFKDARFDPEKGFFLNGRPLKLNGMCIHQDFAGVGVALPYELTYYKYKTIKEMGVNAVRTVHNPPSPDALDACDRLGILIMDETRMCGSSVEALHQIETLVRRDRNHVSLLMWSLGNEENTVQSKEWGARMARTVRQRIQELTKDPIITYGANNGGDYTGINSEMQVRGINYIRINSSKFHPDDYHQQHPQQALYSSEEGSVLTTRGVYENDYVKGYVDAYGNNCAPWGSTAMGYLKFCMSRDWFCGGFIWTGFDYRGEPTPYVGSILHPEKPRNTVGNFGVVDLCGFPKDVYYYYRAHWRNEPLLHLLPHWNFREGEPVRVMVFTNCDEVTLYLNGKEISTQKIEVYGIPEWTVSFEPGELKAVGRKGDRELTVCRRTSTPTGLRILTENCGAYTLATVDAIDPWGDVCEIANDLVRITCEETTVLGVGNGDPTSRLRERYFDEEEVKPLPPFRGNFGPAPSPFPDCEIVREGKHPRFEDQSRLVWKFGTTPSEEYTFKTEFEVDEEYQYIEFPGIRGEGQIFLNGKEIGRTPPASAVPNKRPYRFACTFAKGLNQVTVKLRVAQGTVAVVQDAIIGRTVKPKIQHPLFHGRMLLLLRRAPGGRLIAATDTGLRTEHTLS